MTYSFEANYLRGLIGASARRMAVPPLAVQQLMEIANDDMITAICGRLVPDIRADGPRLGFREFGEVRPADPDKERQFEEAWNRLSYDEPWNQLLFGYSVKRRVSVYRAVEAENAANKRVGRTNAFTPDNADDLVAGAPPEFNSDIATSNGGGNERDSSDPPFIVNPLLYSLQWEDSTNGPRRYVAVDRNNHVMTDVVIHVSADPDPLTGQPTSPAAKLLPLLLLRRQLFNDAAYCSYWAAHNSFTVQTTGMGAMPNPNDAEYYADGLIAGEQHLYERTHQQVTASGYDAAVGRVQAAHMQNAYASQAAYGTVPGSALYTAAMRGAPMTQPPYQRALVMAPGKQIAPIPSPSLPAQMAFVLEQISAAMMNVFGLMPNMLANAGSRVVAQADNDRALYETKKQEWQATIERFLTDTYNQLYDEAFVAYAVRLEQAIRGDEAAAVQLRNKRGVRKAIVREVRENVRAVVTIARRPPATLDEVQTLVDRGWISEQTAAEAAVRIVGLSSSLVTTEEERRKLREQKQNDEVALAERMSIAQAAGKPQPAAAGAPTKRPPPANSKPSAAKKSKASDADNNKSSGDGD